MANDVERLLAEIDEAEAKRQKAEHELIEARRAAGFDNMMAERREVGDAISMTETFIATCHLNGLSGIRVVVYVEPVERAWLVNAVYATFSQRGYDTLFTPRSRRGGNDFATLSILIPQ